MPNHIPSSFDCVKLPSTEAETQTEFFLRSDFSTVKVQNFSSSLKSGICQNEKVPISTQLIIFPHLAGAGQSECLQWPVIQSSPFLWRFNFSFPSILLMKHFGALSKVCPSLVGYDQRKPVLWKWGGDCSSNANNPWAISFSCTSSKMNHVQCQNQLPRAGQPSPSSQGNIPSFLCSLPQKGQAALSHPSHSAHATCRATACRACYPSFFLSIPGLSVFIVVGVY